MKEFKFVDVLNRDKVLSDIVSICCISAEFICSYVPEIDDKGSCISNNFISFLEEEKIN